MGSLPDDTRCGWCGRIGAGYIPDGIDPPVPLCGHGGRGGLGCLFDNRDRFQHMANALETIWCQRAMYMSHATLIEVRWIAEYL
jgi:hypothetical protein